MAGRRGWGEDSIYFDHSAECRDSQIGEDRISATFTRR
jgi:hypothetical protein